MNASKPVLSAVAIGLLVILGIGAINFVYGNTGGACQSGLCSSTPTSTPTSSQTYSVQGGSETVVATYVSSAAYTQSTSSASTSSASTNPPPSGTFTYSPAMPLKILNVSAEVFQSAGGNATVTFSVAFENVWTSPITVITGGGSSLSAAVTSGSAVVKESRGGPVCEIAEAMVTVDPGQNRTAVTPGCWDQYGFFVVSSGTVQISLALDWGTSTSYGSQSGTTTILAQFTF